MLCDAIITNSSFNEDLKKILIRKWLLNTACIAFNQGDGNTEGVLTLQGKQGIGKTRLIRKLIPMYVKTGLVPIKYPRKTSFYATINNEEFLKDESGNRRYWVITVEKIDFELIDKIDIYQLWGEVMHIREKGIETTYLTPRELNMLNNSNSNFKVLGQLEITIDKTFVWEADEDMWKWMSSKDIINKLYLKSTKGLRSTLESYGAEYQKKGNQRGYLMPPENLLFE